MCWLSNNFISSNIIEFTKTWLSTWNAWWSNLNPVFPFHSQQFAYLKIFPIDKETTWFSWPKRENEKQMISTSLHFSYRKYKMYTRTMFVFLLSLFCVLAVMGLLLLLLLFLLMLFLKPLFVILPPIVAV